jgi:hypothetical protein
MKAHGGGFKTGGGKLKSGGGTVKITKTVDRQTKAINDNIVMLRSALFNDDGSDKDVTRFLAPAFLKFEKNGLDLSIEFSTQLNKEDSKWAFDMGTSIYQCFFICFS